MILKQSHFGGHFLNITGWTCFDYMIGTLQGHACYCDNKYCSNSSIKHTHSSNESDFTQQGYV